MIEEAPASVRRTVADRTQPPVGGPFVLGRRASLLVSAGVVSHTLWTSAAPALTYGIYAPGMAAHPYRDGRYLRHLSDCRRCHVGRLRRNFRSNRSPRDDV